MSDENKTDLVERSQEQNLNAFGTMAGMNDAWKIASQLAKSTIVPKDYQGNPANCLIALDVSVRIGMSPLMVMQELYVVHGKPSWSGKMAIAIINGSRRYREPLKFKIDGTGKTLSCYAWTTDLEGEVIKGATITMSMVIDEGWSGNKKWQTMPEQMMMYRAASFFAKVHCPDLLMGLPTSDEIIDVEFVSKKKHAQVPDTFNLEKKDDVAIVEDMPKTKVEPEPVNKNFIDIPEDEIPDFMKGVK